MTTLFNLTAEYRALLTTLTEADVPPETMSDTLEAIQAPLEDKFRAMIAFAIELEADANAAQVQVERLEALAKSRQGKADWLRNEVLKSFRAAGFTKSIVYDEFTLGVAKNIPSVFIEDEDAVPAYYRVEIPAAWRVDRRAILAALKTGAVIPGARIADKTYRLSVK